MKHKCKNLIFAALAVLLISGTALGIPGNASTPVILTVNFQVQDTAFTVTPVGTETVE